MTASSPPPMTPREFVGVTQASTTWSVMEPRTISTSGFSSKLARHESIIFGLMSTRMTLTVMLTSRDTRLAGLPPPPAAFHGELDEVLLPLLLGGVDHKLVVVELRVDLAGAADAV